MLNFSFNSSVAVSFQSQYLKALEIAYDVSIPHACLRN